ncbi:hypothetical protein GDO81_017837 [Engystomops pustulosus]|uniref:Uncharacterized protein n=1 Tax=Engystomops pustulosus TaxID=76066 RepID=A0AAV7A577_ENGPU|nr:hypothetical protein GDO81_017837 [Engystomops pustulosus]
MYLPHTQYLSLIYMRSLNYLRVYLPHILYISLIYMRVYLPRTLYISLIYMKVYLPHTLYISLIYMRLSDEGVLTSLTAYITNLHEGNDLLYTV